MPVCLGLGLRRMHAGSSLLAACDWAYGYGGYGYGYGNGYGGYVLGPGLRLKAYGYAVSRI